MEIYAQYSVSDWIFESEKEKVILDYVNKEQITYGADGEASITLWFQIQSDTLKKFFSTSKNKTITLNRERWVRAENGGDFNLKEAFGNVALSSLIENNEANEVAHITLHARRDKPN